jgi:hypothetical protein
VVGTQIQETTLGAGFVYSGAPLRVMGEVSNKSVFKQFTSRDLDSYYKGDIKPLCAIERLYKKFYNGNKYKNSYYNLLNDKYGLGSKGFLKAHEEYLKNLKGCKNYYCNHKKFCNVKKNIKSFPGKQLYREKRKKVLLIYRRKLD